MNQLDKFLDDAEKFALKAFVQNDVQREALRKVLLRALYRDGVMKPGEKEEPRNNAALYLVSKAPNMTNELLGQNLRAYWEGITLVEQAFKSLDELVIEEKVVEEKDNPAR